MAKKCRIGVGETVTLTVPLKPGLEILSCVVENRAVADCSHTRTRITITGIDPGMTTICLIVGRGGRPVLQLNYVVQVIEEDEE